MGKAKKFAALAAKHAGEQADRATAQRRGIPAYQARAEREEADRKQAARNGWVTLQLGSHTIPDFDGIAIHMSGARLRDYPKYDDIPSEYHQHHHALNRAANTLMFNGGNLETIGRKAKEGYRQGQLLAVISAFLMSFEPKHEHKSATVAWFLDVYTDAV